MINTLPPVPNRGMAPSVFIPTMDTFLAYLQTFANEVNATASTVGGSAVGGADTIQYTFSSTNTTSDPGGGFLRLSSPTQNASAGIYLDPLDVNGRDWTGVINQFDASTSVVKGSLRIFAVADASKFIDFQVTSKASPTGYFQLGVTPVAYSSTNPFTNGQPVMLSFTRAGDKGIQGTPGAPVAVGSLVTVVGAVSANFETGLDGTYPVYLLTGRGVTFGSTNDVLTARFKKTSYQTTNYAYHAQKRSSGSSTPTNAATGTGGSILLADTVNTASKASLNLNLWIRSVDVAYEHTLECRAVWVDSSGNHCIMDTVGGYIGSGSTAALQGLQLITSGGTFSGNFRLFGLNGA